MGSDASLAMTGIARFDATAGQAGPGWPNCALKWIFKLPLPELQVDAAVPRTQGRFYGEPPAQHTPRPHARARAQTCCTGDSKAPEQLVPQGAQADPDRAERSRGPHRNVAR